MRELSQALDVSPRTVTDLVDGLEARALVRRRAHPTDRRVTLLELTDAGTAQLAGARCTADAVRDLACSELSDDERATLQALLARISGALGG